MSAYAVVEIQGYQFKIEENRWILIPFLGLNNFKDNEDLSESDNQGDILFFDKILFLKKQDQVYFGDPYVKDVQVEARILKALHKGDKINVFKYKRSKGYRRKYGYASKYTKIQIQKIHFNQ